MIRKSQVMRSIRQGILRLERFCVAALCAATLAPSTSVAQPTGSLITQQWKSVGDSGVLRAGILPPSGVVTERGGRVSVAVTGADGTVITGVPSKESASELLFSGVRPGTYSLVAAGPNLVALYAVHFVAEPTSKTNRPLLVAPANLDVAIVRAAATRYLPDEVDFAAVFAASVGSQIVKQQEIAEDQIPRIRLSGDLLKGQAYRAGVAGNDMIPAGANNVLVYQNQTLVKQLVSQTNGSFEIDALPPGAYSIIIAGPDGMAVTGFEIAENRLTTAQFTEDSAIHYVTQPVGDPQSTFAVQLAPVGTQSPAVEMLFNAPGTAQQNAAVTGVPADQLQGMSGGGGGGGGGALGGGAGLGPILGLGGIGAAAAIASSDDDDTLVPPPIASPITP
ncbi:collagen binding domain-containing protein [Roseiconus lacunae]|uniref:hypothetical protein n=1 Tax=Roseiconus lacunae TaxID=2605694 RepID=UPI001E5A30FB|nr:hypothetical protein [Roseiconus lacunae]